MRKIFGNCSMPDCGNTIHSKNFCRSHYRKLFENKARYQKVKNDPELFAKTKQAVSEYRHSDRYKLLRKEHDQNYYKENKEALNEYRKKHLELQRFGTRRENILFRDGFKCALCNNTESLVIHHKNGLGRCTDNPDNNPKNLITVCRSCHMKIHGPAGIIEV